MTPQRTAQAIAAKTAGLGGDMSKAVYDSDNDGKVDAAESADSVPWSGVTGKPGTYPPAAHQHSGADIASGTVAAKRLPAASTSAAGIAQLNNSTSSTSTSQAATAAAVKSAYDLASCKSRVVLSTVEPAGANVWYQELYKEGTEHGKKFFAKALGRDPMGGVAPRYQGIQCNWDKWRQHSGARQ
ncbi:tail fiber protein [Paenibacillus sp. IB182496]|uniref:Tail fiber protein n=2 Tax=Paenibacillus sabuli TaxID=2772509 RepID=A0A927GSM5_9BACL|nr:tail fiber protein [Paenibacillus sabuli]